MMAKKHAFASLIVGKTFIILILIAVSLPLQSISYALNYEKAHTYEAPPIIAKYREVSINDDRITPFFGNPRSSVGVFGGTTSFPDKYSTNNKLLMEKKDESTVTSGPTKMKWFWATISAVAPFQLCEEEKVRPRVGVSSISTMEFTTEDHYYGGNIGTSGNANSRYRMKFIYDDGERRVDEEWEDNILVTDVYIKTPWKVYGLGTADLGGGSRASLSFQLMHWDQARNPVVDHVLQIELEDNSTQVHVTGIPLNEDSVEGFSIVGPLKIKVGVEYEVQIQAGASANANLAGVIGGSDKMKSEINTFACMDPQIVIANETGLEFIQLAVSPEIVFRDDFDTPELCLLVEQDGREVDHVSLTRGPVTVRAYIDGDVSTSQIADPFNSSILYGWYCSNGGMLDSDGVVYDGVYSFDVIGLEPGYYTLGVFALDNSRGSLSREIYLPVGLEPEPILEPANIIYKNIATSLDSLEAGEQVTITVTLVNMGGESGTETVILLINGEQVDAETVIVAAGDTETATFIYTPDTKGTLTVKVDTITTTFTVTEPEPEPEQEPSGGIPLPTLYIVAGIITTAILLSKRNTTTLAI